MTTDVNGWVEWRWNEADDEWTGVIKIGMIVAGNYDMYGCLFGVRNYTGFRPVAYNRGLPTNASDETKAEYTQYGTEAFSPSWIAWPEIAAIDWSEEALDYRVYHYKRYDNGQVVYQQMKSLTRNHPRFEDMYEGMMWEEGDTVYKVQSIRKQTILDILPGWQLIFEMMAVMAMRYGNENVRLVVWFSD